MKTENLLIMLKSKREILDAQQAFIETHSDFINSTTCAPSICYEYVDFDNPLRDECISILRHFGGRWEKEYKDGRVNYTQVIGGIILRIYKGEPPPSCRIIEEVVDVPEIITPAHKEVRKRIICNQEQVFPSDVAAKELADAGMEPQEVTV